LRTSRLAPAALAALTFSFAAGCSTAVTQPLLSSTDTSVALTEKTGLVIAEQGTPSCSRVYRASFRNSILEIRPGETMCWEIPVRDEAMDPFAMEPDAADADRTIVVKMWQDGAGRNTFLTFHNPFDRPLKYRTQMMRPDSEDFEPTTACGVNGRHFTIEQWPQTIMAIRIADAEFVDEDEAKVCN
jgi:hypothetical protein